MWKASCRPVAPESPQSIAVAELKEEQKGRQVTVFQYREAFPTAQQGPAAGFADRAKAEYQASLVREADRKAKAEEELALTASMSSSLEAALNG